jgi:HSP20 family protein
MANLVRWDPFAEMASLRDVMDRVVEQAWVRPTSVIDGALGRFPVDLFERGDAYVLTASLPGVAPDAVDVTVHGDSISISYERTREDAEDVTWHARELPTGRFTRQFSLPVHVDNDGVQAHMEHGLLRLTLPKVAQARERRIQIQAGGPPHHAPELQGVGTSNGHDGSTSAHGDEAKKIDG